jgi:EAL domain-containing protein (putative c-di-GMP-specific phosphodiesterase class I)
LDATWRSNDFGTGFGSFTYLKHLPARYLKIDMEFVRDINEDPTDREIVRSIVGIAHTLGKETIAEGVENADVQQTLRELDVDYAQGFYIGSPAPIV